MRPVVAAPLLRSAQELKHPLPTTVKTHRAEAARLLGVTPTWRAVTSQLQRLKQWVRRMAADCGMGLPARLVQHDDNPMNREIGTHRFRSTSPGRARAPAFSCLIAAAVANISAVHFDSPYGQTSPPSPLAGAAEVLELRRAAVFCQVGGCSQTAPRYKGPPWGSLHDRPPRTQPRCVTCP